MLDQEVYDLQQTGDEVQQILNKGQALPSNPELQEALDAKQDVIPDLGDIRNKAERGSQAYEEISVATQAATDAEAASRLAEQQARNAAGSASEAQRNVEEVNSALQQLVESGDIPAATEAQVVLNTTAIAYIERCFGKYDTRREITLSQATAGKYVSVAGAEVSASGYGISNSVEVLAGDILLIPSASAVPADVSVVARVVTRTYQKVINYTYTYQQANPELYDTATADYDQTLVYTAVYDTSGETPVLTGWTRGGETYETLPATYEVTESYYEPLVKQSTSAMPSTGYYIYLCPTPMTIVISGYTATVDGGVCLAVGWGIFKNICTNFVGAPGQAVIAQAFAQLLGEINGLKAQLANLGETRAVCINSEEVPQVQNVPMIVYGSGAPATPNVPAFVGQKYLDTTNKKEYTAFSVTNSISDWVLIN